MNILAIGCHPDDLEIGCAGTLAKYVKRGDSVTMCHITNGNLGHKIIEKDELGKMRNAEAASGATVIGAQSVTLDIGDMLVEASNIELTTRLIEVVRDTDADIVITHNPDDYMRDHMETSKLAFNATFGGSVPHVGRPGSDYNKIPSLFYMDTLAGVGFVPTEYVDVTDEIEMKLEALACHVSQIKWMKDHDGIDFIDFVRTCSKYRGLQCGVPYAEGFRQEKSWPRMKSMRLLP